MWPNSQETADLVTFTKESLNWKLHVLCSGNATFLSVANFFTSRQLYYYRSGPHSKSALGEHYWGQVCLMCNIPLFKSWQCFEKRRLSTIYHILQTKNWIFIRPSLETLQHYNFKYTGFYSSTFVYCRSSPKIQFL